MEFNLVTASCYSVALLSACIPFDVMSRNLTIFPTNKAAGKQESACVFPSAFRVSPPRFVSNSVQEPSRRRSCLATACRAAGLRRRTVSARRRQLPGARRTQCNPAGPGCRARLRMAGPMLSWTATAVAVAAAAASETVKGGAHIPSVPRRTRCRRRVMVSNKNPPCPVPKPTLLPPRPPPPRRGRLFSVHLVGRLAWPSCDGERNPARARGGLLAVPGLRSGAAAGSEPQAGRQILLIRGRARNARTDVRRVYDYSLNYFHISYV
ncbi:hypothetical protein PVAP13_3KG227426 [Panicum virgatum]|uniref:Uncharacterized protein n=1 Tax=Panicum virgatum TaxID=38727 RepID=A0A8T0V2H4_PANVG|nr:hypothetical protein PVAP13_3KG227426 [Panicum virgatum]